MLKLFFALHEFAQCTLSKLTATQPVLFNALSVVHLVESCVSVIVKLFCKFSNVYDYSTKVK